MVVTIKDVADRAGVSAMSVSRVLNGQPGVSTPTRERIEAAIRELGYRPGRETPRTHTTSSRLLGMIVPDISNPFFAPVVQGAERAAGKAGYRILICNSENDLRLERDYVDDLVTHNVAGLIIAAVSDRSREHLDRLQRTGRPVVLLDRTVAGFESDSVTTGNADSAAQLVRHLIGLGHGRIAFVSDSPEVSTGRERLAGFRAAVVAAGRTLGEDDVVATSADLVGGRRAAQQLLAQRVRPSAVVAVNNMTALGLLETFRERGVRVPDDIALTCFDDVQHLAIVAPVLTVIDQPAESMAGVAAQLLIERITNTAGPAPRNVVLPSRLIVRTSCGSQLAARGA